MDKLQRVSGDLSFAFFNIYICVLRLIQFIMILRAFFSLCMACQGHIYRQRHLKEKWFMLA